MRYVVCILLVALVALASCTPLSTQPSTAIVRLRCSPPGDNGYVGCASTYDLRWGYDSGSIANILNWTSMNQVAGEPTPRCAGLNVKDTFIVSGLPSDTILFFCVRVGDEIPNWSALSNIKRVRTPDGLVPGPVIDLEEVK